jgi:glutathione-specific gamma-glutamylcyclotransferase
MSGDGDVNDVAYFGYGSLVNELTWARPYEMQRAEIRNWTREWKHCVEAPFGRICALTATRASDSHIQGILLKCNYEELSRVDEREIGYERVPLSPSDLVSTDGDLPANLFIYQSLPEHYRIGDTDYPLWLSYVEVVAYGYLRVFGEAGIDRFIQTTRGWATPMIDDRNNPKYPRWKQSAPEDRRIIEEKIRGIKGIAI